MNAQTPHRVPAPRSCSVVIRTYNQGRHLRRLLEGIAKQTVRDVEVVVVDSGSSDETADVLASYDHKLVHIPPARFTFGRALNMGCAAATRPFLVFASAHVYPVFDDWLEAMLRPFDDDAVALTYGCQRGPPTAPFSERMIFRQWFPDDAPRVQDHPFCNNANAAIRRGLWEKLPYDETLSGLEDLDWAKRAIKLGYSIRYVPEAEIIHVHEETSKQTYRRYFREAMAMRRIYPDHKFSAWDFARLTSKAILHDYRETWREGCLARNLWDVPRFRLMQMAGTWRGTNYAGSMDAELRKKFYYPGVRSLEPSEGPADDAPPRRRIEYHEAH